MLPAHPQIQGRSSINRDGGPVRLRLLPPVVDRRSRRGRGGGELHTPEIGRPPATGHCEPTPNRFRRPQLGRHRTRWWLCPPGERARLGDADGEFAGWPSRAPDGDSHSGRRPRAGCCRSRGWCPAPARPSTRRSFPPTGARMATQGVGAWDSSGRILRWDARPARARAKLRHGGARLRQTAIRRWGAVEQRTVAFESRSQPNASPLAAAPTRSRAVRRFSRPDSRIAPIGLPHPPLAWTCTGPYRWPPAGTSRRARPPGARPVGVPTITGRRTRSSEAGNSARS